ncbi:receptor-like cytosolic serine/threonine-protein kinase RBK2 isoform X2 [Populus alba x Populus x berolinensis]|uniref:non-specific serine/threonine protein kinase n=1 Tax=Populus alba x Populus x berolinensis TaxID=444605 RepID=A0AAD6M9P8_9ROSI|nr:receptor-like cytosolic serine/threonine-protein kinase RBK2 isoform X2 [Populus alba x Populus x berolinensis]
MEDVQQPSASVCNGSQDAIEENQEKKAVPVRRNRLTRSRFSYSFSSHDKKSFTVEAEEEEEEEKKTKDGTEKSSPRGVLEDFSVSVESETSSKASTSNSYESEATSPRASTSGSEGQPNATTPWRDFFRVFKKGPAASCHPLPPLKKGTPKLSKRKSRSRRFREEIVPTLTSPLDGEFCHFKSSWKNFSLSELHAATDTFSQENLIGEGGYAEVYKGKLEDGQFVAIKRLTRGSPEDMTVDFLSELGIIVHVDHPNIAKVIGYGVEGGMHLVLELSANGSLASLLYGPKEKLDWRIRYKIALGTARGLLYLHEECQRRIIHKDIKASNILLTEDLEPQISDFGLAKWLPEEWSHHTLSKIEGTFGYLPPEFFMHGIVDEKTDVYAYGVLLLELITGRQALDSSQQSLVMWAKPLLLKNSIEELVDPILVDAYDSEQMDRLACTASMCIHQSPSERPQMSQAVRVLQGDESSFEELKQRQRTPSIEDLYDADENDSTEYLSDLNQQMEVVLSNCNEKSEEHGRSTECLDDPNQQEEGVAVLNRSGI